MSDFISWKPSASINNLSKRSEIIRQIRDFFSDRGLLEVETPGLSAATVTDIHLVPFQTYFGAPGSTHSVSLYLMTSPEFHMKRLLAAGSGPIFQIFRSFRNEEVGRYHNPEFTMLEWYRPCYDMYRLMNEVNDLLQQIFNYNHAEMFSYQQIFSLCVGINPLSVTRKQLYEIAVKLDLGEIVSEKDDSDTLLQLLFTIMIEPNIGHDKPVFIYHFPASQASLAEINTEDHRLANRFEVYFKGVELANGFHELTNACEQRYRFEKENRKRAKIGLISQPIDENLLAALEHGMPECSGVALGVDRLVMLKLNVDRLSDVIAFPIDRA